MITALLALTLVLVPRVALACTSCLWGAYGDRTFNWAFFGLIIMPFGVAAAIGGVLAYVHRRGRRWGAAADPGPALHPLFKETS